MSLVPECKQKPMTWLLDRTSVDDREFGQLLSALDLRFKA